MKDAALALIAAFIIASAAPAQERTAGSTLDTQMTWSALSSKISTVDSKAQGISTRVDQIAICGNKGKVCAPAASGKDAHGCIEASVAAVNHMLACNRQGKLWKGSICVATTTDLSAINAKLAAIAACGAQKKSWNGSGCVDLGDKLTQVGTVTDAANYSTRTITVNFPQRYAQAPNVYRRGRTRRACGPQPVASVNTIVSPLRNLPVVFYIA
ncbi:hypothetical protein [Ensifer sesbaniae]|uniref:hypothetical protein n=1 Tax=Ensifer sesbaniae TaxID=1214071 RepID=UPI001569260E|nr:hypothetical protein [Ensifer sesbaniae]NRQ16637.1 hypothetical protein [Ensifer sesbaniae]